MLLLSSRCSIEECAVVRLVVLDNNACTYIVNGEYPADATRNERRSIRRKAKKFCVREGELFYTRANSSEVSFCWYYYKFIIMLFTI